MKKYIISTFLIVLCTSTGLAQRWELNKANRLFEKRAYLEAAEIYERSDKDVNTLRNLGDCYYLNTKMDEAVKWYGTLVKNYESQIDYQYFFRYSQALKGVKRYEEADQWMEKYEDAIANDASLQNTLEYMAKVDADVPYIYTPVNSETNSEYSDFGTSFFGDDKVIYASANKTGNTSSKIYKWNDQPYLDLYVAKIDSEGNIVDPKPLEDLNSPTHDALAVISKDGNTMYFSRTNEKKVKVNEEKVANIKIFKAELIDNKWTNIESLPFNSDEYSCGHPALSHDGKKMYFTSDMPGSIGSLDIFEVDINEDGTFGTPKNLGPNINTTKRDEFPYMSDYNILYFASNGHLGLGNLDIFYSALEESKFGKPKNLGSSVNSSLDDFSFIINEETDKGFFSSNREGAKDDDIFQFRRKEYIKPVYLVEGVVTDKNTGEVLPNSLVTLLDENNNVIADTIVKADGKYIFHLDPNQKYKVRGTRKLYIPDEQNFSTDSEGRIQHNIELELELYSDAEGNIVTENGDTVIKLEKIYFDFDKWDIKPAAAKILDGLVEVMKKYPNMIIEISAHTDCRGGLDYNLDLSHKRAKSTLDYVVSQGIDVSRLKSIGYGEMQPLNKCVREGICTEAEYDVNRRCEFKLLN
ncbi:MAG: OmpA family protein [Flavobacteriaceae bacterium]|nr:OmpA family protein [Flavobacteriaceae bacterium]